MKTSAEVLAELKSYLGDRPSQVYLLRRKVQKAYYCQMEEMRAG